MDAQEFLGFADELSGSQTNHQEASDRTIISRLYYGIFLQVQGWLEACHKQDYLAFKGSTHLRITNCLSSLANKYNQPELEQLAEKLKNFKGDRVTADYYLHFPVNSTSVEIAKQKRDEVLKLFCIVQLLHIVDPSKDT